MKIDIGLKAFDLNNLEELIQRISWRLVRSANDRFGDGKGQKKLDWATGKLEKEFPNLGENAEDYIRAAYINFKTERGIP